MTHRGTLVERVRDEISGWPIGSGYYGTKVATDEAAEMAVAAVDAALPQVTTVDEVTALPHRTVLVSAEGEIFHWSWRMPMNLRLVAEGMLESGPLTVVWQPS